MGAQLAADLPADRDSISLSTDLLWGVAAIAAEIGKTERQVFHLIATKQIPAGKIGGRLVASRTALRLHFAARLSGDVG
jgi:hypothetical protein